MGLKHLFVFVGVTMLAGCAIGHTPQTAAQFRAGAARGVSGTVHQTYQVTGSYRRVAARIRRKAAECFNRTVTERTCYYHANCTVHHYTFDSHFTENRNGAELVVQMHSNAVVNLGGKPPKGGNFVGVADIAPAANGRTRIAMYGVRSAFLGYIPKAVKHWADDSNLGCPDFASDM